MDGYKLIYLSRLGGHDDQYPIKAVAALVFEVMGCLLSNSGKKRKVNPWLRHHPR